MCCVKDLLTSCGYVYVGEINLPLEYILHLSKNVTKYFTNLSIDEWKIQIHNSPNCLNYKINKTEYLTLRSIFCVLTAELMYTFCKFRRGILRLPIETGRLFNIEKNERL